jgi:hypothetical protein
MKLTRSQAVAAMLAKLGRRSPVVKLARLIAALCLMLLGASPVFADEFSIRKAEMEKIHGQIVARDFAALDSTERAWRVQRSRTATGMWKLELFYNAMWYLGRQSAAPDCSDPAEDFLAEWRRRSPKSPAPFIVSANRILDMAWCYRGSGMADTVSQSEWPRFHERVNAAYAMLASHKSVASADPHYYAVMASIYVAQGRDEDEFVALLKEATTREPYYYPLYDEAFRYYEPHWFGSYDDEEALAQLAVRLTHDKDRSSVFARIYWNAMDCSCLPPAEKLDQPVLKKAMQDLADLYPDPWNVAHLAKMACGMRDGDLARHFFDALPAGDDGRAGWQGWDSVDLERLTTCRVIAGFDPPK